MSVYLLWGMGEDWRLDIIYIYSGIAGSFLKETLPPLQSVFIGSHSWLVAGKMVSYSAG